MNLPSIAARTRADSDAILHEFFGLTGDQVEQLLLQLVEEDLLETYMGNSGRVFVLPESPWNKQQSEH